MAWMVVPSVPAFAALFPASTGMFTLTRNRIDHLRWWVSIRLSEVPPGYRTPLPSPAHRRTFLFPRSPDCLGPSPLHAPSDGRESMWGSVSVYFFHIYKRRE